MLLAALALLTLCQAAAEQRHFELSIEEIEIEALPGFKAKVWTFNGQVSGPLLHIREGDQLEVVVQNNTTLRHCVHWHGVFQTTSWQSDGVPDVTQKAIAPGESYTYRFVVDKPGSLWYHYHVNVAEHVGLRGMWGPLVIDPKQPYGLNVDVLKGSTPADTRQRRRPVDTASHH